MNSTFKFIYAEEDGEEEKREEEVGRQSKGKQAGERNEDIGLNM